MVAWKKPDSSKQPVRFTRWSVRQGRVTVEIDSTTVNVTATGLSGRNHWSEPLSSFTGVFRRGTVKYGGEGATEQKYYIELLHPVPGKTVPLYSTSTLADAHKKWKEVARSLKLPTIEDTPVGRITRQLDDLDKSIRTLLAESKVSVDLGDVTKPPLRVLVKRYGETVHIVFRPRRVMLSVLSLLCFGLGGFFYYGFGSYEDRLFVVGSVGLIGLLFLSMVFVYREIVATPSMITSYTRTPIGNFGRRSIPSDELHSVVWAGQRFFTGKTGGYLSFASDTTEICIPLAWLNSEESANWLGRIVMAAAAGKLPKQ